MINLNPKDIVVSLLHDKLSNREQVSYTLLAVFVFALVFYFPFLPCLAMSKWFLVEIAVVLPVIFLGIGKLSTLTPKPSDFARDFLCLSGVVALRTVVPVLLVMAVALQISDPFVYELAEKNSEVLYEILDASMAFGDILAAILFFYVMNHVFVFYKNEAGSSGSESEGFP